MFLYANNNSNVNCVMTCLKKDYINKILCLRYYTFIMNVYK